MSNTNVVSITHTLRSYVLWHIETPQEIVNPVGNVIGISNQNYALNTRPIKCINKKEL